MLTPIKASFGSITFLNDIIAVKAFNALHGNVLHRCCLEIDVYEVDKCCEIGPEDKTREEVLQQLLARPDLVKYLLKGNLKKLN